tara:strand:+ start:544 stop:1305 length:762 start_codon:yes stop_codon:yes gene_type:complete
MKTFLVGTFFGIFISTFSFAQRNASDTILATPWISVNYGANWTSGDLDERFGFLNNVGFLAGYKTSRNWIFGVEGNFIFGSKINVTGLFDELVDSKGNVTDVNGDIAIIRVLSRGFSAGASVGKIFPVLSPNKNSGIYASLGIGYLAYKLRIETQDQVIPLLELDYRKGYDRLTSGLNLSQFIGYALMANRGAFNFYGGFYLSEGFTYNRRTVFFDQPNIPVSKDLRLDIQYGFKVGWLIPIYKRLPKEFYYN